MVAFASIESAMEASTTTTEAIVPATIEQQEGGDEEQTVKDPRTIARKYQLELAKKAVEENVIVYLGTGCGKTHIAVLLIWELGHLIRKPEKNVCVFLAPTVPLVHQQADVIMKSTDFKVQTYVGHTKHLNHQEWEKEMENYEVLVMTPQILLRNLFHRLIKMELIAILIFDECHHAQAQSSHPYSQIMKAYKRCAMKRPRIFGMTASPIVGKGGSSQADLSKCINSLENLLDSKVYSVEDKGELEKFVASPSVSYHYYIPTAVCTSKNKCCEKLGEIKNKLIASVGIDDINIRKLLQKLHDNLMFCLENLGIWGAVEAVRIYRAGDQSNWTELMETDDSFATTSLTEKYLTEVASSFDSDLTGDGIGSVSSSSLEELKEPFYSAKLLLLIKILSTSEMQQNMKCIIFVDRIVMARTLSCILGKLECLNFWKGHFLVGFHSGLKGMSRKAMNTIVDKFRSGELNLLVATKVGEEGLDIQTCCLVIRYDLPQSVASFVQSRGRARMSQSKYAFLINSENQSEMDLIEKFKSEEDHIDKEIECRTSEDTFDDFEEEIYEVPSTGAYITAGYSVSLLNQYCSKLPHDEYFNPRPEFYYIDDIGGTVCRIILPSNATIHEVAGLPQPSKEKAKKTSCLKACKELHAAGALTDHLLFPEDEMEEGSTTDSDSCQDESPRGELYEMLTPAALKEPWTNSDNSVILHFYYIQLVPVPEDRLYQQFGLFVKSPLPSEAEVMELDLHLAHGRIVKTKLVHVGEIEFNKDEIVEGQKIQELFLKIILDRSEFFADYVPLGSHASLSTSSTFYLLLPVGRDEHKDRFTIDWKIIRNCLSSPVFRNPTDVIDSKLAPANDSLILADGPACTSDIVNSLVFTPHNKLFFFVDEVLYHMDANSPFTDDSRSSYVEHYSEKFGIHLSHPKQPLLKAKQLFSLHNLLHNRVQENTEARKLEEHFVEIPPELCLLKIIRFSKDIGSSLSLLPSIMHRLENLLVAIELKGVFSASFMEGSEVTALRVLEAITTEKCSERFSLERLEILGDAFLKYAVGRHLFLLHETLDEGHLTRKRSSVVNNSNLYKLATRSNLQVYIRDELFDPSQFYALGRPYKLICNEDTALTIHSEQSSTDSADLDNAKCSKGHQWLQKKAIADVVEALIGAFIVDSGFKAAIAFLKWIGIDVDFEASQVSNICRASKSYMSLSNHIDISALENSLGHRFLHKGLLVQAFLHPSYNKHSGGCYQRLEFLGDAVLDYLITSYLYSVYPRLKPGQLTDLRSASVNNTSFGYVAAGRCLHRYLINDSGSLREAVEKFVNFSQMDPSKKALVQGITCPKALGDVVESSVGAMLLDSGFNLDLVWQIMLSFLEPIMSFSNLHLNPARLLQELCQSHKWNLEFSKLEESKKGAPFVIGACVTMENISLRSRAIHRSKKAAERISAEEIYLKLKAQGYKPKKGKTLEHILKVTKKEEAKLIGYDETPVAEAVLLDCIKLEDLDIQDRSLPAETNDSCTNTMAEEPTNIPNFSSISRQPTSLPQRRDSDNVSDASCSGTTSQNGDRSLPAETNDSCTNTMAEEPTHVSYTRSAISRLHEICATRCWDPPVFECIKTEGPSHLMRFAFKVTVKVVESPGMAFECESELQPTKKAAKEQAAAAALWYWNIARPYVDDRN